MALSLPNTFLQGKPFLPINKAKSSTVSLLSLIKILLPFFSQISILFQFSGNQRKSWNISQWELPKCGDVQEERHTPAIPRGSKGVLQWWAGDDNGWDPEGVHGGSVVGKPPLLPRQPVGAAPRWWPGREVS